MARRGIGLGFASVIAYDPYASEVKAAALGVKLVPWEEALARGDFFSLHMPMTSATKACAWVARLHLVLLADMLASLGGLMFYRAACTAQTGACTVPRSCFPRSNRSTAGT